MNDGLDAVPGGLLSLSNDLRILAANRALGTLVGRSPAELVGQSIDVILTAASRILFQTHVYPALTADGSVEEVFLTLSTANGATTPVLMNAARSMEGGGVAYDALIVQIRARARWEADLLTATQALKDERVASETLAANLAATARDLTARIAEDDRNREFRDAFVGVVSHELRTPITTIYGMSHVLRRRHRVMDPDTVEQHLGDILEESDRLRRLTEDLLVLSRAEGARLILATEPMIMSRVVERAVASEQARATGHRFAVDAPPGLPLVAGEDVYVDQVIRNYLSNATKYSLPDTTVHVSVTAEDGGVAVRVIDEGPGLRDEEPDRLFEVFYRSHHAIGQTQGAGIGLFVCRELIHAMDGRVWAAQATGPNAHGAEFGFWLPAADEDLQGE